MPWEDEIPAVASAGNTVDVAFASLSDYLAKTQNLNTQHDDPVLYLFPAWTFHGGGFISFNKDVPQLDSKTIKDPSVVKKFLSYKIGAQKSSPFYMLIWQLADSVGMKLSDVKISAKRNRRRSRQIFHGRVGRPNQPLPARDQINQQASEHSSDDQPL